MGTGSGQSAPARVPFQLNLPASGRGPTEPELPPKDSNNSFGTGNTSDEFGCTAEHDALVNLPLVKTTTGEESEVILFGQGRQAVPLQRQRLGRERLRRNEGTATM